PTWRVRRTSLSLSPAMTAASSARRCPARNSSGRGIRSSSSGGAPLSTALLSRSMWVPRDRRRDPAGGRRRAGRWRRAGRGGRAATGRAVVRRPRAVPGRCRAAGPCPGAVPGRCRAAGSLGRGFQPDGGDGAVVGGLLRGVEQVGGRVGGPQDHLAVVALVEEVRRDQGARPAAAAGVGVDPEQGPPGAGRGAHAGVLSVRSPQVTGRSTVPKTRVSVRNG